MQIKRIMTRGVQLIAPEDSLSDVAQKMKEENTGALPVCDGNKIRGLVTDRDIVVRVLAEGKEPRTSKASDVMTRPVFFCYEDDDVREAAKLMQRERICRLAVLNRDKKLVGLVSIRDLAIHCGDPELVGKTLAKISARKMRKNRENYDTGSLLLRITGVSTLGVLGYVLLGRPKLSKRLKHLISKAA